MYARLGLGCSGCPGGRCGSCGMGDTAPSGDPLGIFAPGGALYNVPLVRPNTPAANTTILTPSANVRPWVGWMDQQFVSGVPNKFLVIGAGAIAVMALAGGSGSSARGRR